MLCPFRLTTRLGPSLGMPTTFQGAVQWSWLSLACTPCPANKLSGSLIMTRSPTLACLPGEPHPTCAFSASRALSLLAYRSSSTYLTSTRAWCSSATKLPSPPRNSAPPMMRVIVSICMRPSRPNKIQKGVKLAGNGGSGVTRSI